ncbi:hypothetical protein [Neokomagataea thailandica]|nr:MULTISPECIES: hypothetical protein [Neokomagataea]
MTEVSCRAHLVMMLGDIMSWFIAQYCKRRLVFVLWGAQMAEMDKP